MTAARKSFGFVERLRARLERRPAPLALPPAPAAEFADDLREKARDVVSGLAALTQKLHLLELSVETLRDDNQALRAALAETGRDLCDWADIAQRHGVWNLADELGVRGKELEASAGAARDPGAKHLCEMAAELKREVG